MQQTYIENECGAHAAFGGLVPSPAEARTLAAVEDWIRAEHGTLRHRCLRLDPANRCPTFRLALPRTINEKYTWRKIFDRDPRFPEVMDKIRLKDWLVRQGSPIRAPRLLWAGTDPEAIPAEVLAWPGYLKAAHGWKAQMPIRPGETSLAAVRAAGHRLMAHRHGHRLFEWGYGRIPPRLLVEEEVRAAPGRRLEAVEVHVFGDRLEAAARRFDRFGDATGQLWRADGTGRLRLTDEVPNEAACFEGRPLPETWDLILRTARQLGRAFDHARIDVLTDGAEAWFGEVTLYNDGGRLARIGADPAHPAAQAWDLRRSWFLQTPQRDPVLETYRTTLAGLLDRADMEEAPRAVA